MANNTIALQAQMPVFDTPYESRGKALQLRQLMNQGEAQDMEMQTKRQAMADDRQLRDISSRFSEPAQRISELYKVNPKAAMAMEEGQQKIQKGAADVGHLNAQTQEIQAKTVNTKLSQRRDLLNTINDPQSAAQWVQGMFADPDLGKVFMHGGDTAESAIKRIPTDPAGFAKWKMESQLGAEKLIQMTAPDANARLTAQTSRDNNTATVNNAANTARMVDARARAGQAQSATQHTDTLNLQRDKLQNPKAQGPMSVTLQKELLESDDAVQSSKAVINTLTEAKKINGTAYSGFGAKGRAVLASNLPFGREGADATVNLDNMMTGQALESLKTIFGGMPTEGERKILLEMQASADKTPKQREDIMDRAIAAAERRGKYAQQKAQAIRSGKYLTDGINSDAGPSQAPAATNPQDAQALQWANANPNDPRAAQIKKRLGQ